MNIKEWYVKYKTRPRKYLSNRRIRETIEMTSLLEVTGIDDDGYVHRPKSMFKVIEIGGVDMDFCSLSLKQSRYMIWADTLNKIQQPIKIISLLAPNSYKDQRDFIDIKLKNQTNPKLIHILEQSWADYDWYEHHIYVQKYYVFVYGNEKDEVESGIDHFRRLEDVGITVKTLSKHEIEQLFFMWMNSGGVNDI